MRATRRKAVIQGAKRRVRMAARPAEPAYGTADEESPEWTADMIARAKRGKDAEPGLAEAAAKLRMRGRPTIGAVPLKQISVRLDPETLATLKGSGKGLQETIRGALTKEAERMRSHTSKKGRTRGGAP